MPSDPAFRPRTKVLAGLLLLILPSLAAAGALVEKTVAFVNKRPVLLSDVQLTQALLNLDEAPALERSIDESLMYEEAARLVREKPGEEAISAAITTLREKAGTGFGEPALRRKALVQLAIASYIDLRLRPLVRVEDAEVRKVFNEKLGQDAEAPPFSQVAPGIREALEGRALDARIEEWVADLRARADIRRPPAAR